MKQPTNGKKRTRKAATPRKATGRPTDYTRKLGETICKRLAEGAPLSRICREAGMPSYRTVSRWIDGVNSAGVKTEKMTKVSSCFGPLFTRARADAAHQWAGEAVEIADDSSGDVMTRYTDKGEPYQVVDHENIQRSRLRVDTRKWLSGKWLQKVYGEKVTTEVSGVDGAPIQTESVMTDATGRLAVLRAKMAEAAGVKDAAPAAKAS